MTPPSRSSRQTGPQLGVLLANVGSPAAPTTSAVRAYLREFLSDPAVVDAPRLRWWILLNLVILPLRAPRSARLYRAVWTPQGAPLVAITERQAAALRLDLTERLGRPVEVAVGMRYGSPPISAAVQRLVSAGCSRIVALPLFPQVSRSTVGTTVTAIEAAARDSAPGTVWRIVEGYADHGGYVAALAASARDAWSGTRPGHLVISFHGLPQRYADAGDPYPEQCRRTADALARALDLGPADWTLAYQSRFGREPWLEPATDEVLVELAGRDQAVDVVCPGFAADCLETLEEVAIRYRQVYEAAGGTAFRYIPALNDRPDHVAALADLVVQRLPRG